MEATHLHGQSQVNLAAFTLTRKIVRQVLARIECHETCPEGEALGFDGLCTTCACELALEAIEANPHLLLS